MFVLPLRRILEHLLKLGFITVTLLLLYKEFATFFVEKPTMRVQETDVLSKETAPNVLVCAEPPFDTEVLEEHGYTELYRYALGVLGPAKRNEEFKVTGWAGNGTANSTDLLTQLSVLKSEHYVGAYEILKFPNFTFAKRRVTYPTYPLGKCVHVSHKTEDVHHSLHLIPRERVKIVLRDPINSANFGETPSAMGGDKIVGKEGLRRKFRIKIKQTLHEEDDPEFECTRYSPNQTYSLCVRQKIFNWLDKVLGCLPPLFAFTGDEKDICQNNFDFDPEKNKNVTDAMLALYESQYAKICTEPCTRTEYEATLLEELPSDRTRIQLDFDPTIDVVRNTFRINIQTFLTQLGGAVSFGRTGLWIFTTAMDGVHKAWETFRKI